MKVLVTGGAGYIGSHCCKELHRVGITPVTIDNLVYGHRESVKWGPFIEGDIGDVNLVQKCFSKHSISAVMHFAAFIVVPESVSEPLKYYRNNTANVLNMLETCQKHQVNKIIFSSTAAVYGEPETAAVTEQTPRQPINPYGASKMMSEQMIMDYSAASDLDYVILRYFNVAGANPEGAIGQSTPNATHLIKVACQAALGQRKEMCVYGDDYDTPDGTCIRDYIHVDDLASAHLAALKHLDAGNESAVLNCGYGHGLSVLEVIDTVKKVSGVDFPVVMEGRRAGDPPQLISNNQLIKQTIDWVPVHDDIEFIVKTAYEWEMNKPY